MQHKDIYDLMNLFFADGFTIENLCEITGVSSELIGRCVNRNNITHEEALTLGKVVTFLSLLYMVDTEEGAYLKESISALECMVIKVILTIARQITDNEERKDFISRVRLYDKEGNEIPLFLKQLDKN